jgi:LysM repeat protein
MTLMDAHRAQTLSPSQTTTPGAFEPEHFDIDESHYPDAATVLSGLVPTAFDDEQDEPGALRRATRSTAKGMLATLPVVLAGSMAFTGSIVPLADPASPVAPDESGKTERKAGASIRAAFAAAGSAVATSATPGALRPAALPTSYRVADGDTVSTVAERFGLSTASVLAANGLGWKSLIFPGQVLKLSAATPSTTLRATPQKPGRYTIVAGDTITRVAARHGLSAGTLLAANNLRWTSIIYPGQTIVIPGRIELASHSTPSTTPVVSSPTPPVSTRYVIRAGDTVTRIAARFGVRVQRVLDANGLTHDSTIYVGRSLTIPAIDVTAAEDGVTPLSPEMRANAQIILAVGKELGVPEYGIIIALAAAMQESSLRNINFGDRDSVGVFQQRPSAGWGSPEDLLTVSYAARLFFGGPSNPNRGITGGLLDVPDWEWKTVTAAAQAVQVSAHPDAYAKWEKSARAWYSELG